MNFELSAQSKEIREAALKFAINEIQPKAQELDEKAEFPRALMQQAWELGLLNTCIPEEFGGSGFNHLEAAIISECLSYGCMGVNTSMMANDLALLPITIAGNQEQKERYLKPFSEQFKIASFCLTEPGHGSDAAGIKTTLKKDGEHWRLNGSKMWITNAGHADQFVVYATLDPAKRHKGFCACIVEKGAEGLELGKKEDKMGHRSSDTRAVQFHNVVVKKEQILGEPGEAWKIAMKTLDASRPLVAASSVGGAQCALDHAKKYARERVQFEQTIDKHQLIQAMIAEMAIKVEAARLLVHKAAWLLDHQLRNTEIASMAKAFAADACMQITTDAVQIFGGYGYSKEYPVEKLMRDAKLIQIYEGTSQIQRLVIAREQLGN